MPTHNVNMEIQLTLGGSWTTVDVLANYLDNFVLTNGYGQPRTLTFSAHQQSQSIPLDLTKAIRVWHSSYGSASAPIFEGFLWECNPDPDDPNLVHYVAYDATHMVGREVPIMSLAWQAGPPIEFGYGAIPRIVFNVAQDSDDDYAYTRGNGLTVGNIIATLLEDAKPMLQHLNAAPASGDPYESTELDTLTVEPQSKVVFESMRLTEGIDQMMRYYPACRMQFIPGSSHRKWKINNINNSTTNTLTLNRSSGDGVVLSMELRRSLDNRYTAVWVCGPPTVVANTFSTADGSLTTTGTVYMGLVDGLPYYAPVSWQITNPDLRTGARRFLEDQLVPMGQYNWVRTRSPSLQLSWDGGTTWLSILQPLVNFATGEATTGIPLYYYVDPPPNPGSDQQIFAPNAVRLLWANYSTPLNIRVPAFGGGTGGSDWEGTAYDIFGMESAELIYDESLAVGYEWGVPVTSATRIAKFQTYAQARLDERKNVIHTGGCVLSGLQFDYLNLDRKIDITANDADGNPFTTGWEDIGAIVTDVEYDFTKRTTSLTFSSDQMELTGMDPEELKRRLKIGAAVRRETYSWSLRFSKMNFWLGPKDVISGSDFTTYVDYVDPETGELA